MWNSNTNIDRCLNWHQNKLSSSVRSQTPDSAVCSQPVWNGVAEYILDTVTRVSPRVHAKLRPVRHHKIL